MKENPAQVEVWDFRKKYCMNTERRFFLTYQDIYPEGTTQYKPLPIVVKTMNRDDVSIVFNLGKISRRRLKRIRCFFAEGIINKYTFTGIETAEDLSFFLKSEKFGIISCIEV